MNKLLLPSLLASFLFVAASSSRAYNTEIGDDGRLNHRFDKRWGLQFVVPPGQPGALDVTDANRVPDFPPGAAPVEANKPSGPALAFPDDDPGRWGRFTFWNGLWWAQNFIQGEIEGAAVERPRKGVPPDVSSLWLRCDFRVVEAFKGKRVAFAIDSIRAGDFVLFVNRRRVGEIRRPGGELDVTRFVTVGATNEFLLFGTASGWNLPPVPKDTYRGPKKGNAFNPKGRIWGNEGFMLLGGPPMLCGSDAVRISDVFANTSWRQKKLIVETEFDSATERRVRYQVAVKDPAGNVVKTLDMPVTLKPGLTVVKPEIPWADPVTWEFGRGHLYTLEAKLVDGGATFAYPPFRFGFREIWREGREIMMNGHRQSFRTVYSFGANKWGAEFLSRIGYNCIHYSHTVSIDPQPGVENLYDLAEMGIGAVVPTSAFGYHDQGTLWGNMEIREDFGRLMAANLRKYRNIPSIVLCYFGVNNIVPRWSMEAQWIGGGGTDGDRSKLADWMAEKGRETNPNVLFFSHADGQCADVSSHNLYLNFTPLQEREAWLEKWNFNGGYPYQAAEFGNPYFQCWYTPGAFSFTEYAAMYYGDAAYAEEAEPVRLMRRMRPGLYIRRVQFPLYWPFTRQIVQRTTRSWRAYGLNAGLVWFNLEEGYGMPGWDWQNKLWNQYGVNYNFKEKAPDRPEWLWPSFDIYREVNQDFLGFLGGAPKFTDKTHAFYSGERVEKQLVMFWDYFEPRTFTADWTATLDGRVIGKGAAKELLTTMNTRLVPIAFDAPAVRRKVAGEIAVVFRDAAGAELSRDAFAFEVHPPRASRDWSAAPECLLLDPDGLSEGVLKGLGIVRYTKIASFADVGPRATHLVVGRNALSRVPLALRAEQVENGLRVLVLPQEGAFWKAVGFGVHDGMSRVQFLRDTVSPALAGLGVDDLHDWRGAPKYGDKEWNGQTYGPAAPAPGPRGPRWLRDMTVAGMNLQSPDVVGFIPQIDGEFDMNYASLLAFRAKRGGVDFCTLDFEERVPGDPAATRAADAVFAEFLLAAPAPQARPVFWSGETARKLLETIRCPAQEQVGTRCPPDAILVAGPDSALKPADVAAAAKDGAAVLLYCHASMAAACGLKTEPAWDVYRVSHSPSNALLRGVGPANLRWRDYFDYAAYAAGPRGAALDMGGMLADVPIGKGRLVFCQLDPTYFRRRIFPWEDPASPLLPLPRNTLAQMGAVYTNAFLGNHAGGENDTLHMLVANRKVYDDWAATTAEPAKQELEGRRTSYQNIDMSVQRMYQVYARMLTNLGADPGRPVLERMLWTKDFAPRPAGASADGEKPAVEMKPAVEIPAPAEVSQKASLYGYPAFRWFDPYKFTYW